MPLRLVPNESLRAGDADVLARLLAEYWTSLVAYAHRLLDDRASAEDVVQRAFVRLWERDHVVPAADEARPFLYRIVRNLALNEQRRARRRTLWLGLAAAVEHGRRAMSPDADADARDLEEAVRVAIDRLPARRREVLTLSRFHGLSNAEIAEVLGISPQTVANQLVSALRSLRAELGPHLAAEWPPTLRVVRGDRRALS